MMRRPLPLYFALLGLTFIWGAPAASQGEVLAPGAGFSLTVDVEAWEHTTQETDGRLSVLAVGPPALGGLVQLSIQVSASPEEGPEASLKAISMIRDQVANAAQIKLGEAIELAIDGKTAHGVVVEQSNAGVDFRVHLYFMHTNGFQYRIQFHAPAENFDEHWPHAQQVLKSFRRIEVDAATAKQQSLGQLAARCGSLVDWAPHWKDAAARAKSEGKLIVVAIHSIPGFNLGDPLMQGPFSDEEVVTLMNNRFVGFVWHRGKDAPFVDPKMFGLGPSTFGSGLLIVKPSGEVVRQVFLPSAIFVAEALRNTIANTPGAAASLVPADLSRADRLRYALDHGRMKDAAEWSIPLSASGSAEDPAYSLQRARYHRIQRDAKAGIAAAELGLKNGPRAELRAALLLELERLHIGAREIEKAVVHNKSLADLVASASNTEPLPDSIQAEHSLSSIMLAWAQGEKQAAIDSAHELCESLPEQAQAWQAAAALIGPAFKMETTPDLGWPDDYAFEAAQIPAAADPVESLEIESSLSDAIGWLMLAQEADGNWRTPHDIGESQIAPDPVTMATQVIAIKALLDYAAVSDDQDLAKLCREAASRGLEQYLKNRELVRKHPREVAYMDYTCWGSSYGVIGLIAVLEHFDAGNINPSRHQLGKINGELRQLVSELVRIQQQNGGWSYYLSGEVGGEATVAAMSFTTATVLMALKGAQDARRFDLEVDPTVFERGYDCLMSMRGTNAAFEYMITGTQKHNAGKVEILGGAARGPLCTQALVEAGRLSPETMVVPFQRYVEHLPTYGDQSRRALMHCGPQTQGSHYLTYDYATGAAALAATFNEIVDDELRASVKEQTLRQLARCRSANGSFIDNPLIGPVAGTGLAIQALLSLR
jgi:hypothetical protein